MNLQFRDLAKPGPSLSEVLTGLARAIIEDIQKLPDDSATRIHDIRVGTKKIQGLLRLSKVALVEQEAARVLCRSIRAAFAGERDEEVLRLRLKELLPAEQAIRQLGPAPVVEAATPEEALAQAMQLEKMIAALDLRALGSRGLARCATASYRKARKLMRSCRQDPQDDPMHRWRKRVKEVTYQAMALSALPFMEKATESLDALADTLGEYHDLAVLSQRLGDHPAAASVAKRKRAVGERAFKQGRKRLARRPTRFAKKLARALKKVS